MNNELYIASAGAGKTSYIVKEALKLDKNILITTFTQVNEEEIRKKFIEFNGCVPHNVTIKTWFSFLLAHGVKPYQGTLTKKEVKGLLLVNQSSSRYKKESDIDEYYFTSEYKIYSDKISKFVVKVNESSNGKLISRISKIFDYIFIDEVQDLAGYDLDIIKLLFETDSKVILAGDPRQVTYLTHNEQRYKKYQQGKIRQFILEECPKGCCDIDLVTLKDSWRNNQSICDFANIIFPEPYPKTNSKENKIEKYSGVYFVRQKDVDLYLKKYNPLQLRNNRRTKIDSRFPAMNFGLSKGKTCDRTIIYPTKPILEFIKSGKELAFESRCKFYVAVTRARYSVGIVCPNNFKCSTIPFYEGDSK